MSEGVVVLGFGPQPIDFFSKAMKVCGKDAVVNPDVARMAGANIAAGSPAALAALRERLEPGARAATEHECAGATLSLAATDWLAFWQVVHRVKWRHIPSEYATDKRLRRGLRGIVVGVAA